jgi:hypothetical protein
MTTTLSANTATRLPTAQRRLVLGYALGVAGEASVTGYSGAAGSATMVTDRVQPVHAGHRRDRVRIVGTDQAVR